jgi:N-acetylmuramoyl-L-alanine amidase
MTGICVAEQVLSRRRRPAPEPTGAADVTARSKSRRRPRKTVLLLPVLGIVVALVVVRSHIDRGGRASYAVDPGAFSPGACVSYAPTSGNRHITVFLDAGHGGIDPGAIGTTESGTTIYEADETLPVELATARILRADGFRVVVSRTRQSSVVRLNAQEESGGVLTLKGAHDDVAARDICANRGNAQILVGIYFDAASSSSAAGSLTAYDASRPFWKKSLKLATLVQRDVLRSMDSHGWQIPNLGVQTDSALGSYVEPASGVISGFARDALNYNHLLLLGPAMKGYFTTPSEMPGALTEPLFITDPFEGSIAASTSGQHAIASGIAQAVEQYFGV